MKIISEALNKLYLFFWGPQIFISYSRKDGSEYAKHLYDVLSKAPYSKRCYIDSSITSLGGVEQVFDELMSSFVLILVGTDEALKSDHVKEEVLHFYKSRVTKGGQILPIDFGNMDKCNWINW